MSDADITRDRFAQRLAARRLDAPGVLPTQIVRRRYARLETPSRFQVLIHRLIARSAAAFGASPEAFVWPRVTDAPESGTSPAEHASGVMSSGAWIRDQPAAGRPDGSRNKNVPLASANTDCAPQSSSAETTDVDTGSPGPEVAGAAPGLPWLQRLVTERVSSPGVMASQLAPALRARPDRATIARVAAGSALVARYTGPAAAEAGMASAGGATARALALPTHPSHSMPSTATILTARARTENESGSSLEKLPIPSRDVSASALPPRVGAAALPVADTRVSSSVSILRTAAMGSVSKVRDATNPAAPTAETPPLSNTVAS